MIILNRKKKKVTDSILHSDNFPSFYICSYCFDKILRMVNFLGAGHILMYIRINIYSFDSYIYLLNLAKL